MSQVMPQIMSHIQLDIQGRGAPDAATALAQNAAFVAQVQPQTTSKSLVDMQTVVDIVSIVGGTLAAAALLVQWYQDWRADKAPQTVEQSAIERPTIEQVIIITPNGTRAFLADLSSEQVADLLKELDGGS